MHPASANESLQFSRAKRCASQVYMQLSQRADEVSALSEKAALVMDHAVTIVGRATALGQANKGLSAAHGPFRQALNRCTAITHDIEIVRREARVLSDARIDLERIFESREIDYGLANGIRVEQSGTAAVRHTHGEPCLVTEDGHVTLNVPVRVDDFGQVFETHVNASMGLTQIRGRSERLSTSVTRGAHFCPAGGVSSEFQVLVRKEIAKVLEGFERPVNLPKLPDLGFGEVEYFAPMFGRLVRVYGTVRRRDRNAVAPVGALPRWADTGIKIIPELVIANIKSEISRHNLRFTGGPWYRGTNAFDIGAQLYFRYRRRIGIISYGADVYGDVVIRTHVRIENRNILVIDSWDIDRRIRVKLKPDLGWLMDWLEKEMEKRIDRKLPKLRRKQRFPLFSARRAEVRVSRRRFMIYLNTRRIQRS